MKPIRYARVFVCCGLLQTALCLIAPGRQALAGPWLDVRSEVVHGTLAPDHQPWALGLGSGGGVSFDLPKEWRLRLGVTWRRQWNDTTTNALIKLPSPDRKSSRAWTVRAVTLSARRSLGILDRLAPYGSAGLGVAHWSVESYPGYDSVYYSANEVTARFGVGIEPHLFSRIRLNVEAGVDFLTGLGTDFSGAINDDRSHAQLTLAFGITIPLQSRTAPRPPVTRPKPPVQVTPPPDLTLSPRANADTSLPPVSEPVLSVPDTAAVAAVTEAGSVTPDVPSGKSAQDDKGKPPVVVDSDSDGVPDDIDQCAKTPDDVLVDSVGCPLDSDGDGVFDGIDRCPHTANLPGLVVDKYGCASDADDDGVPDYRDACPDTPDGSLVDDLGCLRDTDLDGVPDERDLCERTPSGLPVDANGCLVMTELQRRLVLHVSYVPGTTDADPLTLRILDDLAVRLKRSPAVNVLVEGFTDNVGDALANVNVSQKRANKIKQYLVRKGIAAARITAVGRGETNFIGSNSTASGRQKNRRIEITFHRK